GDARTPRLALAAHPGQHDAARVLEPRRLAAGVEDRHRVLVQPGEDRVVGQVVQLDGRPVEAAVLDDRAGVAGDLGQQVDPARRGRGVPGRPDHAHPGGVERGQVLPEDRVGDRVRVVDHGDVDLGQVLGHLPAGGDRGDAVLGEERGDPVLVVTDDGDPRGAVERHVDPGALPGDDLDPVGAALEVAVGGDDEGVGPGRHVGQGELPVVPGGHRGGATVDEGDLRTGDRVA